MKTITIDIEPDGSIEVKGGGFTGKECTKHIDKITAKLGTVTKSCKLPEYFQQATTQQKVGK